VRFAGEGEIEREVERVGERGIESESWRERGGGEGENEREGESFRERERGGG
jgi:hypothetical protein